MGGGGGLLDEEICSAKMIIPSEDRTMLMSHSWLLLGIIMERSKTATLHYMTGQKQHIALFELSNYRMSM